MQEQLRTIRLIFSDNMKNDKLRKIFNDAIFVAFLDLQSMTQSDIETIMSFIPETSFQLMTIGTPCIGNDGKTFSSLGFVKSGDEKKASHTQALFSKSSKTCLSSHMSALYYDTTNPGR